MCDVLMSGCVNVGRLYIFWRGLNAKTAEVIPRSRNGGPSDDRPSKGP